MTTVTVNKATIVKVLQAFVSPSHELMELRATINTPLLGNMPPNPVRLLMDEVQAQHDKAAEPGQDRLLKMIAHRARTFPNYPLGYHIPEIFAAVGEVPPEPKAEPEQEPVAWMRELWSPDCGPYIDYAETRPSYNPDGWKPLYTSPQPRATLVLQTPPEPAPILTTPHNP